ncbi:MAG: secreted hydrolase [Actinomycetia bacterium]|nr:secreted hydrolase [Actinomycetes bacterium]
MLRVMSGALPTGRVRRAVTAVASVTALAAATVAIAAVPSAEAAGQRVTPYLTTTSDDGGRVVSRGLAAQPPIAFTASSKPADETITVDENTRYQTFSGGGASITDTTAYLLRGGTVSASARDGVMRKLFDPKTGIGLSFLRNPIGASDLSRPGNVSLDDTCCDVRDFGANGYDTNVRLLTAQAKRLNPQLRIAAAPWSAPGWMKDNLRMDHMGALKREYYPAYARYFVRYVQSYAAAGVKLDYVSVQNEPNCCHADDPPAMDYPGMVWTPAALTEFTRDYLFPAFRAAHLRTQVLVHDFNYGDWDNLGKQIVADPALRADPLFGGIAWHGYWGDPATGSAVHEAYPSVPQFSTEHSGGTWVANQQNDDLADIVNYARNWSSSLTKWSIAVNQDHGPHNGGCGSCTGLVTIPEGGPHPGRAEYTIEYYTTGHLTKFVRPGARRIASNDGTAVRNVAWRNPDGSKALIAHNGGTSEKSVRVVWGSQSFTYTLPAHTTATFTWQGTPSPAR